MLIVRENNMSSIGASQRNCKKLGIRDGCFLILDSECG